MSLVKRYSTKEDRVNKLTSGISKTNSHGIKYHHEFIIYLEMKINWISTYGYDANMHNFVNKHDCSNLFQC